MKAICALLLFIALALANDVEECKRDLEKFEAKLHSYGNYNPVEPTAMKMFPEKDRKRDNTDAVTDCFNSTDIENIKLNCESHECLDVFYDLAKEYDSIFGETCSRFEGFTVDKDTLLIIQAIKDLEPCNKCVVLYTTYKKKEGELKTAECWPTVDSYSCDGMCVTLINNYIKLHDEMLRGGKCRMNNPGGCGSSGGMTEGQIYDALIAAQPTMDVVVTVETMCMNHCEAQIKSWHQKWKPLADNECLQSANNVDLAQSDLTLRVISLEPQCDQVCVDQIQTLISDFSLIPQECQKYGLQSNHLTALVNSINTKNCDSEDEDSWDIFGQMTVAKGFFTLSILGVGCVLVYLIGGVMYRRCVKGKKGWDSCPTFLNRKKGAAKRGNSRQNRNQDNEDEEVILFEADDDDDNL